jgi:hypothetical protein
MNKKIKKLDIECLINLCVKILWCVYAFGAFVIFDNSLFVLLGANLTHLLHLVLGHSPLPPWRLSKE